MTGNMPPKTMKNLALVDPSNKFNIKTLIAAGKFPIVTTRNTLPGALVGIELAILVVARIDHPLPKTKSITNGTAR
jgi:hypothetical protein